MIIFVSCSLLPTPCSLLPAPYSLCYRSINLLMLLVIEMSLWRCHYGDVSQIC
ncbi:MAG: hypothetical protein F6K56_14515 [Moorea sp. SIO3G5]|nr:hypothetical protein [Moorena sp. SIO3G5]